MAIHYCEKCKKPLVKAKPHYIPLGTDEVLKIIDETCEDCGGAYINKNQQTTVIKNKEAHDRLIEIMKRSSKGCDYEPYPDDVICGGACDCTEICFSGSQNEHREY